MVIDGEEEGCLQWLKEEYDITVFVFVCTWFTILFFFLILLHIFFPRTTTLHTRIFNIRFLAIYS